MLYPGSRSSEAVRVSGYTVSAPIAFFFFNRPELTARVFAEIARVRPSRLLLVTDGPRPHVAGEEARSAEARRIAERIDWPCEVVRNYSAVNLGCGRRLSSGLDWVFRHVERAIVVEDDCVPQPTFFRYADQMLDRYAEDDRVMHVAGTGGLAQLVRSSYVFSIFPFIWGWATWRRAWRHYDFEMTDWPARRERGWLQTIFRNEADAEYWRDTFDLAHAGKIDAWDPQWIYACWRSGGLSIIPAQNLVTNIGVGPDATHTNDATTFSLMPPPGHMPAQLSHPARVGRVAAVDALIQAHWSKTLPIEILRCR